MYIGLHVKYPSVLPDLNETWIFSTDFWKCSNIIFDENQCSGNGVVPWGKMDRHDEANSRFSQILRTRLKIIQTKTARTMLPFQPYNFNCPKQQVLHTKAGLHEIRPCTSQYFASFNVVSPRVLLIWYTQLQISLDTAWTPWRHYI
jgi:hypothetical protein